MAHHKSALKRIQIAEKQRQINRTYHSKLKTAMKKVLDAENKDTAAAELNDAYSIVDKLVKKGIIPKNRGAHKKSRLMRFVNAMN